MSSPQEDSQSKTTKLTKVQLAKKVVEENKNVDLVTLQKTIKSHQSKINLYEMKFKELSKKIEELNSKINEINSQKNQNDNCSFTKNSFF